MKQRKGLRRLVHSNLLIARTKGTWLKPLPLFLLVLLLIPAPLAAQSSLISWTIVPGFDGSFKAGAWIPVTITISNGGPDVRGRIEWRWAFGSARFSQTIDLPRGSKKRLVLPVLAEGGGSDATLTLYNGNTVIASDPRIRFNMVDPSGFVVGVLSDNPEALPEAGLLVSPRGAASLVRLAAADLPERPELLQSLDVLFVHDVDSTRLSDGQRSALALWVASGGALVAGGDRPQTSAGLGDIVPAQVSDPQQAAPLRALGGATGWQPREAGATAPARKLAVRKDVEVLAADGGRPLLLRRDYGSGVVLQTAFDLQALARQGSPARLWAGLLPQATAMPDWSQVQGNEQWMFRQSFVLPGLRLPSIWALLGFLGLYIVLVGPANYLLLRRAGRPEWAYVTIPLTVALFTGGAYAIGAAGRGGSATATGLTIVSAAPGSTGGESSSFVGLYSPARGTYRLGFPADSLVRDMMPGFRPSRETIEIRRTETAVEAPSFFVDVGAMRALGVQRVVPAPQVQASLAKGDDDRWRVEVENRSAEPLVDAVLLVGQSSQSVEDLKPGERRSIDIALAPRGRALELPLHGTVINRSAVLQALQDRFGEIAMPMPPNGSDNVVPRRPGERVVLTAWSGRPGIEVTADGAPLEVQGDTLYRWPLGSVEP